MYILYQHAGGIGGTHVFPVPADRSERDLWSADFTNHDGIAGQP